MFLHLGTKFHVNCPVGVQTFQSVVDQLTKISIHIVMLLT